MLVNLPRLAQYPIPVRLGIFLSILLLLWLPVAAPIYLLVGDRNLVTILTMGLLFGLFIPWLRFWNQRVYGQTQVFKSYGLERSRKNAIELLNGLTIGLFLVLILFWVEWQLGWVEWQQPKLFLLQLVLEGLLSALGTGLAEEFVFRGWLLDELQKDYRFSIALWANAGLFAVTHFIKPLPEVIRTFPQFPGLLLLGLTLVWAKRKYRGRLGILIGLHAGLVWGYYIINVGQMVRYSDRISNWVTGVDGNPLAGLIGLIFLSAIAFWYQRGSSD